MRVRLWAVQSRHSDGPSPAVATQTPASRDHGIAGDFGGQARDGKFLNAVDGTRGLEPVQVKTQKILNFSDFGVNTLVVTNASWVANENHPRWGRACGSGEGTGGGGLCLRVAGGGEPAEFWLFSSAMWRGERGSARGRDRDWDITPFATDPVGSPGGFRADPDAYGTVMSKGATRCRLRNPMQEIWLSGPIRRVCRIYLPLTCPRMKAYHGRFVLGRGRAVGTI